MPRSRPDDAPTHDRLQDLARELAESHVVASRLRRTRSLLDGLPEQESVLRAAYSYLATASDVQLALSYAAEWLLDNFHLVEQALRQIREDMPPGYYRQLPKLNTPPLVGLPRVYGVAREIIGYFEGQLDIDRVTRAVIAYQGVTPLTMGELWALPTMLRVGVLEDLSRAIGRIVGVSSDRPEGEPDESSRLDGAQLEADEAVVAGAVQSLRMLATQDWKAFFESVSLVEEVLRGDPAGVYARMDFDTRDRCRGVVEELALATRRDEEEVARAAIRLAEAHPLAQVGGAPSRFRHVGYYLLDRGRAILEARLGYRPSLRVRAARWMLDHPTPVYLGGVALLTLVSVLGGVWYAHAYGGTPAQLIGASLFVLLPASALAVSLTNWIVTKMVTPRLLPRLDFRDGIPSECGTLVALPVLLTDADEVRSLLRQLELHYLGNADPNLCFALLTDFADAPQKHMPADEALLQQVEAGVRALNDRYGKRRPGPFYLLHRDRELNPAEQCWIGWEDEQGPAVTECWMGWERKRGKLVELNQLLTGEQSSLRVRVGDSASLQGIRYVITLDADTLLPRDGARCLVATLSHPLNQAEFDPQTGAVVGGYTVLQPRVEIKPTSASRTVFAQVFSGDTGVDLYSRAVSDVYHDLFGEGIYAGKGIYGVAAFRRSLEGRVPQNALLSHDLFEGIHGRAGLVTDEILYEDYPSHYLAYTRRLHRWVRGDWQLLPWVLPKVPGGDGERIRSALSVIDRWKIVDNLRRSLVTPAVLALLLAGWLWLPGSAVVWTLATALAAGAPVVTSIATAVEQWIQGAPLRGGVTALRRDVLRWLLGLVFCLYESLITLDAILSTLHRLLISRKRLLQWTTAAHTIRLFGREARLGLVWRKMGVAALLPLGLAWLLQYVNPAASLAALPFLCAWMLAPHVAYWISRPLTRERAPLSADERQQLRRLARRKWLYFERFVGPDDQWLPPDHFQEQPLGLVAHRTSPTNLGVMLLSTLAAHDLGYIGTLEFVLRLRPTFDTMSRLERHRGHLFNWYDTHDLSPLPPRYVSTVDSGNLAAALLALKQGCTDLARRPVLRWEQWQGLLDTLDVLTQVVGHVSGDRGFTAAAAAVREHVKRVRKRVLAVRDDPGSWALLLADLGTETWPELERLLISLVEAGTHVLSASALHELRIWSERVNRHLQSIQTEVDMLLYWLLPMASPPQLFSRPGLDPRIAEVWHALREALPSTPPLQEVPVACRRGLEQAAHLRSLLADLLSLHDTPSPGALSPERIEQVQEAHDWCVHLIEQLGTVRMSAESLLIGLHDLSVRAEDWYRGMSFRFLFNPRRQVFHIGYNVETGTLDRNYYDLLASEARIASLLAIANGDVPQSHWLHLSRPITQVNGTRALLSWGASMFEYLMPSLFVRAYPGTLLEQSCRAAVDRHLEYGSQKGVPWGISESGYYRFDSGMHYQYRGFGVPGLGFKRGLAEDLVVAPYASLLALGFQPQAVMRNIAHLSKLHLLGLYGFYEAIDFTRSRVPSDQRSVIVRSHMAHHQGMALLSLTNYLCGDVMVHRFHAQPRVQSVELLLQEQVPQRAPVEYPHPEELRAVRPPRPAGEVDGWPVSLEPAVPQVHVLSNGRYTVLITGAGGGYSSWQDVDLTRWRADATLDNWGTWVYVEEMESGEVWSVGSQPAGAAAESQEVSFFPHKADFGRRVRDISVRMEVIVSPDDDVEVRRVTLVNHSDRTRRLRLTSYGEVVLAPREVDRRHPAFNKLFIESEYVPELRGLLFRRRVRSAEEKPIYLAHTVVARGTDEIVLSHEGDRARFLGRGRDVHSPGALGAGGAGLSGTTGATLDPIMALGNEVELRPHATAQIAFLTAAAGSREEVWDVATRYQAWPAIRRSFVRARAEGLLELHRLDLSTRDLERIQRLLSVLVYPYEAMRAAPSTLVANRKGQSRLWAHGVSGDHPVLLVRVAEQEELDLLRELLRAHIYWRSRELKVDLVILNERETGYDQELQGHIYRLIARMDSEAWIDQRGGIFVLQADQMSEADRLLLATAARAVLEGDGGSLAEQVRQLRRRVPLLPRFVPTPMGREEVEDTPPLERPGDLLFDNGLGGFSADGKEYVIYLEPGRWTPAPWINVVGTPQFGFLVSEAGSGYTWAENSGENRLTPWHNDPVTDPPGEALCLRDEETAELWSPTPLPMPASAPYLVRHGAGYSVFEHHSHGLRQRLRLFAVPDAPVKVVQLRLENTWSRDRRITTTFYAEWVLGTVRDITQQYITCQFDAASRALLARNPYNDEFGERVAFAAASRDLHGLTADRAEFLGREGHISRPAALERIGLAGNVRAGLDPCAALQVHIDLAPGETQEVCFLLGQGANRREARRLVERYRDGAEVQAAWDAVNQLWDDMLGTVTVHTPDPAMDLLLNRWLLYQALSCRVWGRSALYQSSGAYGYRDQMQDVMALVHAEPDIARHHILEAAGYQFEAGDVLHWWHPPSGRGVRTRCSDDLLWLPYVTAHYVEATGDDAILTEEVSFLKGLPLEPDEIERYGRYESTDERETLYKHCLRALKKGTTAGPNGLPLIGSHDWNDGLNRVGLGGRGESVWLGWFLYATLMRFAPLCERMGDQEMADAYRNRAEALRQALEDTAWDGNWYRRAYYDDGTPLGSAEDDEARIDSIAQSWAVLSGAADPERATQAMEAVAEELVRIDDRLMLLFTPPFDKTKRDPGYIKGYPPGVRENGGQYTHAALWAVWAFAELGEGDRAEALFRLLNPIYRADSPEKVARYRVEPYVVAADVYGAEPYIGRGGWTWYTGSAGWMYRLGLEAILGLRRAGKMLQIDPAIPETWRGYELTYRYGETSYRIRVGNPHGVNHGVKRVVVDGEVLPGAEFPLVEDGRQHQVRVLMG